MRRSGVVGMTMAALALTVTFLLGVSAAGAQSYPGSLTITLSGPSVSQGGTLSASMTGCAVGESIHFVLNSDPLDMGTVVADGTGKGTVTITIPADFPTGPHTVTGTCGSQTLSANVEVLSRSVTPATNPAVTSLPVTGSDTDLFLRGGVSLVAVGGLLVVVAFAAKRRSASAA